MWQLILPEKFACFPEFFYGFEIRVKICVFDTPIDQLQEISFFAPDVPFGQFLNKNLKRRNIVLSNTMELHREN